MKERHIKFYVNPRDIAIIEQALFAHMKKIKKLSDEQGAILTSMSNPIDELGDYVEDLLTKVRNLKSHHPYKPKKNKKGE